MLQVWANSLLADSRSIQYVSQVVLMLCWIGKLSECERYTNESCTNMLWLTVSLSIRSIFIPWPESSIIFVMYFLTANTTFMISNQFDNFELQNDWYWWYLFAWWYIQVIQCQTVFKRRKLPVRKSIGSNSEVEKYNTFKNCSLVPNY